MRLSLVVRGVAELVEVAGHQESDLLGDIDRVVADPFDLSRDDMHADAPFEHPEVHTLFTSGTPLTEVTRLPFARA